MSMPQIQTEQPYAPEFFIIGAPKCGTTALYAYLNEHPDVFMPAVKEPNFYAKDLKVQTQVKTQKEYNSLFKQAKDTQITGEASVWYLLSDLAVKNILQINPNAKFIAMIRNPLEMYSSLHAQLVYSLWENIKNPEQAYDFKKKSFSRFCTDSRILDYKFVCSLGEQLERFTTTVPEHQRMIIFHEDFKNDTSLIYKKTLQFIGLKDDRRSVFPVINDRKEHAFSPLSKTLRIITKNLAPLKGALRKIFPNMSSSMLKPLYDLGSKKTGKTEVSENFKRKLLKDFEQDIQKIEKITGRNLGHWRHG